MKKILVLLLLIVSISSCTDKLVVNNAFVYLVRDDCYQGGMIEGEQWQSVLIDNYSSQVTAIPNNGYKFVGWSDGLKETTRHDRASSNNNEGPIVFYAIFEIL